MEIDCCVNDADFDINEITALSGRDEETGLVQVELYDKHAIHAIMEVNRPLSEERMLTVLAKVCALLHHNSGRAHETNQKIIKIQIQKKVDDIVKSYNGRVYVVCQVASGVVKLAGATLAAGGQHSIKFLGKVSDMNHYAPSKNWRGNLTSAGQLNVQQFVKATNNATKHFSEIPQTAVSIADNSAQAWRTEGQGHKTIMENENQQGGQRVGNEQRTSADQVQQVDRIRQQRIQVFQGLAR